MTRPKVDPSVQGGPVGPCDSTPSPVLVISCDTCVMASTTACDDCIVPVLCSSEPTEAVILDLEELRALRLLAQAGMVPTLRHRAAG